MGRRGGLGGTQDRLHVVRFVPDLPVRESQRPELRLEVRLIPQHIAPLLKRRAVEALPEPIIRRNPTLSNPFVRGKVYELACGEPLS